MGGAGAHGATAPVAGRVRLHRGFGRPRAHGRGEHGGVPPAPDRAARAPGRRRAATSRSSCSADAGPPRSSCRRSVCSISRIRPPTPQPPGPPRGRASRRCCPTRRRRRWRPWRARWMRGAPPTTPRPAGSSCTGVPPTTSSRASCPGRNGPDARPSSSRWTPTCSAGVPAISTSAICRSAAGRGIAQYTSDPVFQRLVQERVDAAARAATQRADDPDAAPAPRTRVTPTTIASFASILRRHPGSMLDNLRSPVPRASVETFLDVFANPALTWERIAFLREHTSLPIVLKGVLHPEDAAPRRRARGGRRRRVEPRWPADRRRGREPGCASRRGRRRRRPHPGALRQRDPEWSGCCHRPRARRHPLSASAARTPTPSRSPARTACTNFCATSRAELDITMGLAGATSIAELTPGPPRASAERLPDADEQRTAVGGRGVGVFVGSDPAVRTRILHLHTEAVAGVLRATGRRRRAVPAAGPPSAATAHPRAPASRAPTRWSR